MTKTIMFTIAPLDEIYRAVSVPDPIADNTNAAPFNISLMFLSIAKPINRAIILVYPANWIQIYSIILLYGKTISPAYMFSILSSQLPDINKSFTGLIYKAMVTVAANIYIYENR